MKRDGNVAALETLVLPLRSAAAPVMSRAGPRPRGDCFCVIVYVYLIVNHPSNFYRKH